MKITLNGYELDGTPEEMLQLIGLMAAPVPDPKPAPKPAAKPAPKPTGKKIDWAKAAALRKAGWSYDKIGEEFGISGVTVSAHLKK